MQPSNIKSEPGYGRRQRVQLRPSHRLRYSLGTSIHSGRQHPLLRQGMSRLRTGHVVFLGSQPISMIAGQELRNILQIWNQRNLLPYVTPSNFAVVTSALELATENARGEFRRYMCARSTT